MDPNQLAKRMVDQSVGLETDMQSVRLAEQRATLRWALRILMRVLIVASVLYAAYRIILAA
jgi:hypothetical protein